MHYQRMSSEAVALSTAREAYAATRDPVIVLKEKTSGGCMVADPFMYRFWPVDLKERYEVIEELPARVLEQITPSTPEKPKRSRRKAES